MLDTFVFCEIEFDILWVDSNILHGKQTAKYIDKRVDTLIIGDRTLYKWRTDIHGNEYALYKTIQKPRSPLAFGPGVDDDGFDIRVTVGDVLSNVFVIVNVKLAFPV